MAGTRSAPGALGAALIRALLRGAFIGAFLVAGWLLDDAPVMALPAAGGIDTPLRGQQDDSAEHAFATSGSDGEAGAGSTDTGPADAAGITDTADAVTGLAGAIASSAASSAASVGEPDSDSGDDASADHPATAEVVTEIVTPADARPAETAPTGTPTAPSDGRPAEPATQPTKPVIQPDAPATPPAKPAATPTEPAATPTEPAATPTEPVTGLTEPVTALTEPVTALTEPVTALAEPVTRLAQPVTALAEPVTRLAQPVTRLAQPVVSLVEPVVSLVEPAVQVVPDLTGATVSRAPDGAGNPTGTAVRDAATPPVAAQQLAVPSVPVRGPLVPDVALPELGTAATAPPGAVAVGGGALLDATTSSTVDYLPAHGFPVAPCSSGTSPVSGSGSAPALPGGNGELSPPAGPAGALIAPAVAVAPGLLAQRPSTSPD